MSIPLQTSSPLTFSQWQLQQSYTDVHGVSESAYISYLKEWYKNKRQSPLNKNEGLKQEYIQLLKDLNFLFSQSEKDLFIRDIDYNNPEDIVLAIPYFAKKLKEISRVLNSKRESVKRAKSKYNLIGSGTGLESLLYDYVLRTFTQRDGSITQIPALPIQNFFPELSAVKNDFFVEIEELYDTQTYHDSDPLIDVKEYLDFSHIENLLPLKDDQDSFSDEDVYNLVSSRFLSKAAPSTLFNLFQDYLTNSILTPGLSSTLNLDIQNKIAASRKYLGETVYGLTAVRVDQITKPDYLLNLEFQGGNNWFLWPSGHQILNNNTYNNSYEPININQSNLIYSGATPGSNKSNSDLIFSDKNGSVEGAWLQGSYQVPTKGVAEINIKGGDSTEFLFPYVGYNIAPKSLEFQGYNLIRSNEKFFNALTRIQQENILTKYYTSSMPSSASESLYLNQTTLIGQGATAGSFSQEADTIIRRAHDYEIPNSYADANSETEVAYVYKFQKTDLPITQGDNVIQWPIQVVESGENLPMVFSENDCLPIRLSEINSRYSMAGAVAGQTFDTSDVIYKLTSRGDKTQASEAAWYGSEPLSNLNLTKQNILVYGNLSAIDCAHAVDGTIQGGLSFKANPGEKVSFIWCGEDTFADEVFRYTPHESYCEYGKTYPHEYYTNQDYVNPVSLSDRNYWTKCTCHAVNYSPIGHAGRRATDYNGITDYLFADPFGLGDKFTIGSWVDTRGFNAKDSPQFSFYQLDRREGDSNIGFGTGRWKTSDEVLSSVGNRMILKTGKRYTYYRTGLRTNNFSGTGTTISSTPSPYLISNYIYKKLNAIMCDGGDQTYDIVIALDYSRSQTFDFDEIKKAVGKICSKLINTCSSSDNLLGNCYNRSKTVQVAVIGFAAESTIVHYLTNGEYELNLQVNSLQPPTDYPNYKTSINNALVLSDYLLNANVAADVGSSLDLKTLCSSLQTTIANQSSISTNYNIPQKGAKKKIILISDGVDNLSDELVLSTAASIKNKGTEIFSIGMGELSITNDVMEKIASSDQTYFNLYRFLISGDGNYEDFIDYVSTRVNGCVPFKPTWRKAIKNAYGTWQGTTDISDMVLRPNDFLTYSHKENVIYENVFNNIKFSQTSISFTINVKLDGWDYDNCFFSLTNIGSNFGAKPFWGTVPNNPIPIAGQIRFKHDYVPVHQPDVSKMSLNQPDYIQYNRYGDSVLKWRQPLNFLEMKNSVSWNKIIFNKKYSNLESILRSNKEDYIADASFEPSDMLLESYSEYKPARYHYYAVNGFVYTENLYLRSRCNSSFVEFLTGVAIEPSEPYANLINRFFPTVATVSFPELAVTEKEVGGYLLPNNLGVSSYRGRGFNHSLNKNAVSAIDEANQEYVFLDPEKYGVRNRGLTKKDQLSPVVLDSIDNKWVMEPFGAGAKAGVILNTKENQKFTPYQSNYEIVGYNVHGLARQQDQFQFWNLTEEGISWNEDKSSKNFRKEILPSVYADRLNKLLANKGTLDQWRSDIYGNDYGLYKQLPSEVLRHPGKLPPVIIFQSPSIEIEMGSYNTLSVTADGQQPFSYQWYKEGKPLMGGGLANYTIYKAVPATSGVYVCVVSNLMGAVSSENIEISFDPNLYGNFMESEFGELLVDDNQKPISWF